MNKHKTSSGDYLSLNILNKAKNNNSAASSHTSNAVGRARSTLSVSGVDYYLNLPPNKRPSPAISSLTLTPGRIRNIDQDMENLRASRQDNPFIQQVIASRESLIDSLDADEDSDHANLMAKELALDLDIDPFSIPELHKHMIRSPPPVHWPKSPNYRVFQFPSSEETIAVEVNAKDQKPSDSKTKKHSSWDGNETPVSSMNKNHTAHTDRFPLRTPSTIRLSPEDSVHLMAED